MANEAAPPPHSPPNSVAAAVAAAASNSPVANAVSVESMEKCKYLFRSLRKYKNAKLLNEIEEHSVVDLNTIASKLKANSYAEPRDFGRDVQSVLDFGAKSPDKNVRKAAAGMLEKYKMDIGPIISKWDVHYWGSLEIEGAIDDRELNEFLGQLRIDHHHLMTDAEMAELEGTLEYYQPGANAGTSRDHPSKRRKS